MAVDVLLGPYPEVDVLTDIRRGPQGPAGTVIGAWNAGTTYATGDIVSRTKATIQYTWIAVQETTSDDPATDDGTNWTQGDVIDIVAIRFDVSETAASETEGQLSWNSDDKTLQICPDIPGVQLQIGQESWTPRVKNETGSQIDDGKAVYISGSTGINPTIALAQADATTTRKVIALATHDIAHNSFGYCTTFGMVRGINTVAWAAGTELYLSADTAGGLTSTQPSSPDVVIRVGIVIISNANTGSIFVTVGLNSEQFLFHTLGTLTSVRETIKTQTNVSGNIAIDCDDGNIQEITLNGNMTDQTFSNVPASGTYFTLRIKLKQDITGNHTAAWNSAVDWGSVGAPTITATANFWDWIKLETTDGGVTWEGSYKQGFGA